MKSNIYYDEELQRKYLCEIFQLELEMIMKEFSTLFSSNPNKNKPTI